MLNSPCLMWNDQGFKLQEKLLNLWNYYRYLNRNKCLNNLSRDFFFLWFVEYLYWYQVYILYEIYTRISKYKKKRYKKRKEKKRETNKKQGGARFHSLLRSFGTLLKDRRRVGCVCVLFLRSMLLLRSHGSGSDVLLLLLIDLWFHDGSNLIQQWKWQRQWQRWRSLATSVRKERKMIQFRSKVIVFRGVIQDCMNGLDQNTKFGKIDQTIWFLRSITVHEKS